MKTLFFSLLFPLLLSLSCSTTQTTSKSKVKTKAKKPVAAAPAEPAAVVQARPMVVEDASIKVPTPKNIQNLREIYKTDGTPQLLLVLHLPRGPGKAFIEAYNHTGRNISVFQFSLHTVGQIGDLSFEDIPDGWSGVKDTNLSNINELTVISPRAIDDQAVEFYPKLTIHYEIGKLSARPEKKKIK